MQYILKKRLFFSWGADMLKPMLCYDFEVSDFLSKNGLDGQKVTRAYREAIAKGLVTLMTQGYGAETKWDGTRVIAYNDGTITLQNRHGVNYTMRLSDIVKGLQQLHGKWTIDCEVVYINPETDREEFTPCQVRCSTQFPELYLRMKYPLTLEVFDALEVAGVDLEHEPYLRRKETLQRLFDRDRVASPIEYVPYETDLPKAWKRSVENDLEGLIVKKLDSGYEHERSYNWLKVKNWRFETCDVVGYTPGENSRAFFFGALVLSKDGQYRGKAGSGFNDWELRKWKNLFHSAPKVQQAYNEQIGETYTAIKTDAKVLIKYYQVTDNKVLRFPIFVASNI
jgi:DNA ligase-1